MHILNANVNYKNERLHQFEVDMKSRHAEIGARIKEIRGDMSQEAFAKKVGASRGAISNYETGQQMPGGAFILNTCAQFQIEPRWLLTGEGPKHDNKTINDCQDIQRHDLFVESNDARVRVLETELAFANERADMTKEMYIEAKEQIAYLREELKIARLERDRANQEASREIYSRLKRDHPDISLPAQVKELMNNENFDVQDSAPSAPLTDQSNK